MMKTLFENARVIDGKGEVFAGAVAVDGKKILQVHRGPATGAYDGFERVDARGMALLPGLIDCHVHLRSDGNPDPRAQVHADSIPLVALRCAANAYKALEAGVTTVRDCGCTGHVDFALRKAVAEGLVKTPRLVLSGIPICMTGGHGWDVMLEADGPDAVRKAARLQLRAGADNVKFIATGGILTPGTEIGAAQLSVEEMRAGIEEAHKAGRITAAHAHGAQGVKNAVLAGIDSVEHGYLMDEEAAELMIKAGTYLVATSTAVRNVVMHGVKAGIKPDVVRKAEQGMESHVKSFQRAWKMGVKLAMGTDTGVPMTRHGNNLDELVYLVEMGLSPMEAIKVSTLYSARLLKLDHLIGTIEPGKLADIVIFDGDPLADIKILQDKTRLKWVILDGEAIVRRDAGEAAPRRRLAS
jgi:imidazolonepropionase-like amidohydrolase